jgi:hypothetical protein
MDLILYALPIILFAYVLVHAGDPFIGLMQRCTDTDVEYIRKDAFTKKVFDAYCKVCGHYHHTVPTYICRQNCDYFSDFKKYIEDKL